MRTPRIFIAATRQDEGKTTTSLGLLTCLQQRFNALGFMKPVGQRYVELPGGAQVDKDVWLFINHFGFTDPPEQMSPITVPPAFTRRYIEHRSPETLVAKVSTAFDAVARGKEFVVLEGTGHAGVGAVFDLSNARVAEVLESPVVLVSSGGIGKPVDEILLNCALFQRHNVPVAGVIINKTLPEKIEEIRHYVARVLAWHGLDLLGVLPYAPILSQPTLREVCKEVDGRFISGESLTANLIDESILVSHFSSELARGVKPKTLLIVTGDQSDVLVACASDDEGAQHLKTNIGGILLVEGVEPKSHITKMLQRANIPVLLTDMEAFPATSCVSALVAKIQPDNPEKVALIKELFAAHVDVARLVEKAG